jgi:transcriptional regulator with XRE-family HTH domain
MSTDNANPSPSDPDPRPDWAVNLAARRRELGLSQSRFAELVGVSQSAVTDWERGKSRPRLGMISKIIAVLEMQPQKLFPDLLSVAPAAEVMVRNINAQNSALDASMAQNAEAIKFSSLFVELFRMREALDMTYNMRRLAEDAFRAWVELGRDPSEEAIQRYVNKERERWQRYLDRHADSMERHYVERHRYETSNSG